MTKQARWRVLFEARQLWQQGYITFDTETTGLGREQNDEIIQWAVCSQHGEVLGSGFIKPTVPISGEATAIHGITDERLSNAPTFDQVWPTLHDLLKGQTAVIYNADFDLRMLYSSAFAYKIEIPLDVLRSVCAMELFAQFYGELHEYYGSYVWQKLETAIAHLGLEVQGSNHDATHDAQATSLIIKKLAEIADQELPTGWHPPVDVLCFGCQMAVKSCAEADEIWYCWTCALSQGLFHRCSGCKRVVERPATGIAGSDLCEYCQSQLHQEYMLLTGQWHWCPGQYCSSHVVETPDLDEVCDHCRRQREWKRQAEERERLTLEKLAAERREARRESARAYRQRQKEWEQKNAELQAQGLPPLEKPKPVPREEQPPFSHRGHLFKWVKGQDGSYSVECQKCQASWSRPPKYRCHEVPTYRAWSIIPEHLMTQTQLRKIGLRPAKDQIFAAIVIGQFDFYHLYDRGQCVPVSPRRAAPLG